MNLLLVSVAFPPKNDPECIQTARYFKYLSRESDIKIDVVTSSSPTLFMPVDDGLKKYDSGYGQKVELPLFESKLINYLLRKLRLGGIFFPDSKMSFHWQWRKVVRKLKVKPDLIYSRSNPMSSAFIALKLKKHFNVPWVMHLSDPWAISPLTDHTLVGKSLRMEEKLLQNAERITFTSSRTMDLYSSKYPKYASKFSVLPNVFDPEDIREVQWQASEKMRIVYTGGLAGKRNVFFLEQVVKEASLKNPALMKSVEFIFAGDMDRTNRLFFEHTTSCFRHVGILNYQAAQSLCDSAHLLLVVDNPTSSQQAIFFPSKLLDYFLVKRKIWAVTPLASFTREILEGHNHVAFHRGEIEKMASFLLESIQDFKKGFLSGFQADSIPEKFGAALNAKTLSAILRETVLKTTNS